MTIMKISRPLICLIGMVICVLVGCVGFARADLVGHETFDRTTHRTSRSEGDLARASSVKGDLPLKSHDDDHQTANNHGTYDRQTRQRR